MEKRNSISGVVFILLGISIIGSVAGSLSIQELVHHQNKWQSGGYAIVGGIFIALATVIVNEILKFFKGE